MGIFMEMANGNKQAVIGNIGNTDIINIEKPNGEELFVLTNNKVFGRFNFVQEFADEDTAWDRAKTISRFENDFANAYCCIVNKDGEIELCVTGKDTLQTYQLFRGELGKTTLDLGFRVVKPRQTFNLPEQAHECIQHINSII